MPYVKITFLDATGGWNMCGGTLISRHVVMTAGHCVGAGAPHLIFNLQIGFRTNWQPGTQVQGFYLSHVSYDAGPDDIAFLRLDLGSCWYGSSAHIAIVDSGMRSGSGNYRDGRVEFRIH